ncbi:MAG: hypothetical protein IPN96_15970 [Anaerolineales bacterium]|nr:hypothetical protein [Anaerolineales bacterium]
MAKLLAQPGIEIAAVRIFWEQNPHRRWLYIGADRTNNRPTPKFLIKHILVIVFGEPNPS